MAIRDVLEDLENLVADAAHVPLSGKCMIDENDLVHLVEELRNTLPTALSQAEDIMTERETIIAKARSEAEHIIGEAKKEAERRVANSVIEREARDRARAIMDETDEKSRAALAEANEKASAMINEATEKAQAMVEEARSRGEEIYTQVMQKKQNVDEYANQVFSQLISYVTNTSDGVNQASQVLAQAKNRLQEAQAEMNQG
jgi:hypothetical protein